MNCPDCSSVNLGEHQVVRGNQTWRCIDCGRYFTEGVKRRKRTTKPISREAEATIVYLDKKVKEKVNWRDWIANLKGHKELSNKSDTSQDEATVRITPNEKGKAGVCISADWHLGGLFTDYDLLQKNLELILNTPYIYQITVGDIVHNFRKFRSLLCIHTQVASPKEQGELLSLILKEFVEKEKWICATWGNHDVQMDEQLYGQSIIAELLGEHFPYFNGKGRLYLLVGEQKYIVEMSHFYPGHSILNPNHSQGRQLRHYSPDADVIVQGHMHQPACQWYYYNGRRVNLVQVGSPTQDDNYFKRFWAASQPGVPVVMFSANKHEAIVYPSLEEWLEK